jgi:hypothetical protein
MGTLLLTILPLAQTGRGAEADQGTGIGIIIGAIVAVVVVIAAISFLVIRLTGRERGGLGPDRTPHRRGRVGRLWPRQR